MCFEASLQFASEVILLLWASENLKHTTMETNPYYEITSMVFSWVSNAKDTDSLEGILWLFKADHTKPTRLALLILRYLCIAHRSWKQQSFEFRLFTYIVHYDDSNDYRWFSPQIWKTIKKSRWQILENPFSHYQYHRHSITRQAVLQFNLLDFADSLILNNGYLSNHSNHETRVIEVCHKWWKTKVI